MVYRNGTDNSRRKKTLMPKLVRTQIDKLSISGKKLKKGKNKQLLIYHE